MENRKTKKEIVKMLLNQNLETEDEEQLMEVLFNESIAIDVDREESNKLSFADRAADKVTAVAGSWTFIILFLTFLLLWIILNLVAIKKLDPYPFILLNLVLSCIAAIQAPIIMMSQNREAKKDRLRNKNDYKTDLKSELISEELHHQMSEIIKNQRKMLRILENEGKDNND